MEKPDNKAILKRMIQLSWLCLGICLVLKIFGSDIFNIAVSNKRFIAICGFIDNNIIAKMIFSFVFSCFSIIPFWLAILQKKFFTDKRQLYIGLVLIGLNTTVKCLGFAGIGLLFDLFAMIIYPCILLGKPSKAYSRVIVGNVLILAFQVLSLLIKDLSFNFSYTESILVSFIIAIDMYIMIFLYYLYQIKEGE